MSDELQREPSENGTAAHVIEAGAAPLRILDSQKANGEGGSSRARLAAVADAEVAESPSSPTWARQVLLWAGAYNLAFGVITVLMPDLFFDLAGMARPLYPELWQCIGMIVGVYGVGYLIAASEPFRHWPIVLVGLLGKIFGPIGFAYAYARGAWSIEGGLLIVFNDLIWIPSFIALLYFALRYHTDPLRKAAEHSPQDRKALVQRALTNRVDLLQRSRQNPILVVFLRHFGCTFCRETLADVGARRAQLEGQGVSIVLVHMGPDDKVQELLRDYRLEGIETIEDSFCALYRAFGLRRGSLREVFGPTVWWRGLRALLEGQGIGKLAGDGFQMPGVFLLWQGEIAESYFHESVASRPDYEALAQCDCQPAAASS